MLLGLNLIIFKVSVLLLLHSTYINTNLLVQCRNLTHTQTLSSQVQASSTVSNLPAASQHRVILHGSVGTTSYLSIPYPELAPGVKTSTSMQLKKETHETRHCPHCISSEFCYVRKWIALCPSQSEIQEYCLCTRCNKPFCAGAMNGQLNTLNRDQMEAHEMRHCPHCDSSRFCYVRKLIAPYRNQSEVQEYCVCTNCNESFHARIRFSQPPYSLFHAI